MRRKDSKLNKKNNPEQEVAETLVNLIRTIIKDELANLKNIEKFYDGIVVDAGDGTAIIVKINDKEYSIPNKTGEILSDSPGDKVRIFYGDKFMTDAYVGVKL